MGKPIISRKAWQRATNVLLWYPASKEEYASLLEELMTKKVRTDENPEHLDPTADSAIILAEDKRLQTLATEIEAVEFAISGLHDGEEEIIRRRFWETPKHRQHSPRQYDFLQDLPYSYSKMRRVVKRTVVTVARMLGEK